MSNKTQNYKLNLFDRGEKPDNELFNENNRIIDNALYEAYTHTHDGINSAKIKATDVKFSNYDTSLTATNIEDAVKEVFSVANRKIDWIVNSIGRTTDGFNNPDRRVNEIEDDFSRGRQAYIDNLRNAPLFSSTTKIDANSSIEDLTKAVNTTYFKDATADASDIVSGSSFYTKYGVCQNGTMTSNGEVDVYPTGYSDTVIRKGGYVKLNLKGFGVDDPAAYIKKGKTIFGVTGRFESDNPTGWNVGDSIAKDKLTTTNTDTCFIKTMGDNKVGFYSSYNAINVFNREWKHFKVEIVNTKLKFTFYSEDFTGEVSATVDNVSGIEEIYSNPVTNESAIMHRSSYLSYNGSFWGTRRPEFFFVICRKNGKDCVVAIWYDNLTSKMQYFGEINVASKYVIQGFVYDKDSYNDFNNIFQAYGYNKETRRDIDLTIQVRDNYNHSTEEFNPTLAKNEPIERGVQDNYMKKSISSYVSFNGGTLVEDGILLNQGESINVYDLMKYYTNADFEIFNNTSGSKSTVQVVFEYKTGSDTYTYETPTHTGATYWDLSIWKQLSCMRLTCTQGSIILGGISDIDASNDNVLFSEEWGFVGREVIRVPLGRNKFVYAYPTIDSNYSYKTYTDLVYNDKKTHVADLYIGRDIKLNDYNFNTFRMSANNGYIYSTSYDTRNYTEGSSVGRIYINTKKAIQIGISDDELIIKTNYKAINEYKPFVPMYISSVGKVVGIERRLTPQKYAYICSMDMATGTTSNVVIDWSETIKRTHTEDLRISNDGNTRNALRMLTGVTECYRGQQLVPSMLLGNIIYSKVSNANKTYSIFAGIRSVDEQYNMQHGYLSLYNKMHFINSTRQ
ncbi:hypothetical protein [uncultured Clostridium sp.]|uniref:hypothetical protein n=1 Tax=uncultured Clostridium sp. TaxID=59620 RepID=UPI0026704FB8|nr:hypothetical protein [uncultured Clostridium sp.]